MLSLCVPVWGLNVLALCVYICICTHVLVHMCMLALPVGRELDSCSHPGMCKWRKDITVCVGHGLYVL